ncbi:MAG: DUF1080 domain-containing protein [Arcicella sp.]|nr:DUF1080 domain-containing protein [Arcicella sp.]
MLKKLLFLLLPVAGFAQTEITLNDLSAFNNPSANWTIEGDVSGNFNATSLTPKVGKGVLFCTLKGAKYQRSDDLKFNLEHGDIKLSMDFMLPKGSNSGIYLQSRYEIQLFDSWLKASTTDSDCGAIYHRWDEARGKGNEGYEGHAPRQSAVKAPGLWNHIDIDFKAPTFDASGRKLTNARINSVVLNGILIHQNVEVLGVTRGAVSTQEVAKAPLMIQGDHGQVALKNIRHEVLEKPTVTFSSVTYEYYEGKPDDILAQKIAPTATGNMAKPTQKIATAKQDFVLKFQGKFNIVEADNYTFSGIWNGVGSFIIDGDTLAKGWFIAPESKPKSVSKKMSVGEHNYSFVYAKDFSWRPNSLGLFIQKDHSELQSFTERTSLLDPDPVPLVEVKANTETQCQRSFVMYNNKKKTHAINVGMPSGLNFSYDLNQGGFLQLWRGKFLNTTEMWHERGEPQTAEPMGLTVNSNDKFPLNFLPNATAEIMDSLSKNDLKYKGYKMEKRSNFSGNFVYPNFMYEYKGLKVNDMSTPLDEAVGISRYLRFEGENTANMPLYALLAEGSDIAEVATNRYAVDNKSYYVQVFPTETNKIIMRDSKGKKQLLMPLNGLKEVSYHLIF